MPHTTPRHLALRLILAGVLVTPVAWAADPVLPHDSLLVGDTLILRTTTEGFAARLAAEAAPAGKNLTAPARTKFKVINDSAKGDKRTLTVEVKDVPCQAGDAGSKPSVHIASSIAQTLTASSIRANDADCAITPLLQEGHAYTIAKDDLDSAGYQRLGFIYGGLVIPYKYFRHDRSFEPAPAVGPYLGYRFGQTGWGVSLIAMYAATVAKIKDDKGQEATVTGVSKGLGVMFDITKSDTPFRAGVMWGKDNFGDKYKTTYVHEGKSWLALQLGWEFR